ncbi:MAG: hypothetical protein DRJ29_15045 [Bacteroidetes bacterium]|nr:MAG: hypothetical protein DRJ29_15045 [Bacteroidota bacterium]
MPFKKAYLTLLIPLVLAILAVSGYGFFFKAAVPGSCALILLFLYQKQLKAMPDIWFVIAAFLFSIAGDWFLSNKGDSFMMFSAGIGLYLLAHVGYLWFALRNGRMAKLFTIVLLAGYLLFFFVKLYPALDDTVLLLAVLLYLLISCFSLGAAFGIKLAPVVKWSYFAGVTLVLLSDTIIALNEFTSYGALNFLILPTYYAAHMSITFALIKRSNY